MKVMDAVWTIQACLNAVEAAPEDPAVAAFRDEAFQHLKNLVEGACNAASPCTVPWRGMGWGGLLHSVSPVRLESAACGRLFLRVAAGGGSEWSLNAAKSVHVCLSSNIGRLFEEGDQFCLSNTLDREVEEASLAASAMCASFCAQLFCQLNFDGGDAGFAQRLMRGVVNRQRDQGNWPAAWGRDGESGEQGLVDHGWMLQSLAEYMAVRDEDYEENYRYGLQWLFDFLRRPGRMRLGRTEAAACVMALSRAQHYWVREARDVDFTLAAACGDQAGALAADLGKSAWRLCGASCPIVLAAETQRARYSLWAGDGYI